MKTITYINILLALLTAIILFHILILVKGIPYTIAWGGRLKSDVEMYWFETISILINLFLGFLVLGKGGYTKFGFGIKATDILLKIFLAIFVLNTVANLFAKTNFEKLFSILTFVFAVLIYKIVWPGKAAVQSDQPV